MKKRDAEASKEKIITNAKVLFSKKGFTATSMDELASICDLNKAMIFYYYKNKQGLFEAVMKEVLEEIYITIKKENENETKPIKELESFIKTYATFACEHPYLPSLLLKELSDSGAVVPEQLFSNMRQLFELFSDILQRGEKKGCFSDVIPMILYFMVIGTLNLMITTKPLRIKAHELSGVDTCSTCNIDEIAQYIMKKIKKMLKDEK
ncbi:TetR/AcrR family transcriptional regulator [Sulfurospirillum sp. 1307]